VYIGDQEAAGGKAATEENDPEKASDVLWRMVGIKTSETGEFVTLLLCVGVGVWRNIE
jgi:hypothetical protein